MKNGWIFALLCLTATSVSGQAAQSPLRVLAANADMFIGAAINTDAFRNNSTYLALAAQQYNIITPENMFKFGSLSTAPNEYNWQDADALVAWAEANDIRVHGHTLVWHNQLPSWVNESHYTPEQLAAILENHIKTLVGRYKGRVYEWDVVNEALNDASRMRDTIWRRALGDDYIAKAFQWAHEADPDALLFYNDYGADTPGDKADAVYDLVKGLVDDGVPINGVGLQMHVSAPQRFALSTEAVRSLMDRLGELGLKVEITEMDVKIGASPRDQGLEPQAEVYRNVLQACIDAPNCDTFITWGVDDAHSWIPGFVGHDDWPLLFDESLNPKPAYFAVADALAGAAQSG